MVRNSKQPAKLTSHTTRSVSGAGGDCFMLGLFHGLVTDDQIAVTSAVAAFANIDDQIAVTSAVAAFANIAMQ